MAYVQAALERSGYPVVCLRKIWRGCTPPVKNDRFLGVVPTCAPRVGDGGQAMPGSHAIVPDLAGRVVFITGDVANEETVATLRETGAPCVEKPFRVQQFIDVISQTMGKASERGSKDDLRIRL